MGLVNDLNYQLECEKIKEEFCLFSDDRMVYCITSLDGTKLYTVHNCYNIAATVQKTYRVKTAIWYVQSKKAQEHFIKCLLVKNTKKLHKENEKLMNETVIVEKVNEVNDLETFYKNLNFACEYQKDLQRKEKFRLNGEKNFPFFPFVNGIDFGYKQAYFHHYLQCYGS